MSEHEEENPAFEDLGLSAEDLTFAEPGSEAAAEGEPPAAVDEGDEAAATAEPVEDAEEVFAGEEPVAGEEEHAETPEEEAGPQRKPADLASHALWIGAVAACVAVAAGFFLLRIPNAVWHAGYVVVLILLVSATLITRKYWATYATTALYTVMLAGTLAALVTGVYGLGLELSVYGWDMAAKRGKQMLVAGSATAPAPVTPAPAQQPAGKPK
jgi:hypothetical protein